MSALLNETQTEEFRRAFDLFDSDQNGTISSTELIVVMQNMNLRPREEEIHYIIKKIDEDGGGSVDFHEFLTIMTRKMRELKQDSDIFETFLLFDTDRNGLISAHEMRHAMRKLGYEVSLEETERFIESVDTDMNGFIDYEEFYKILMED